MTSKSTFPQRLTRIDTLMRSDHYHLTPDDTCYFIGEYTARKGYAHSPTNRLIINLKKTMDRHQSPEWRYKEQAIQEAASAFRTAMGHDSLDNLTFVPIPPSKAKSDPLYDDRLTKMLNAIRFSPALDIRELIVQKESTEAAHDREERPTPEQIEKLYQLDQALIAPMPKLITIVDDILTTGAHFRAAKSVLSAQFPTVPIIGLFVARRVFDADDLKGPFFELG